MDAKITGLCCAAALVGVVGCSQAPMSRPPAAAASASTRMPDETVQPAVLTVTAPVLAVNRNDRTIRLRGVRGQTFTLAVGTEVPDFDQIRAGDTVTVRYYESVLLAARRPDMADGAAVPGADASPVGDSSRRMIVTGPVVRIDPDAHTFDVGEPDGGVQTIHVTSPELQRDMEAVRVGNQVTLSVTKPLAISLQRVTLPRRRRES